MYLVVVRCRSFYNFTRKVIKNNIVQVEKYLDKTIGTDYYVSHKIYEIKEI